MLEKTVVSIAIILKGIKHGWASIQSSRTTRASLVVLPPALIDQGDSGIKEFSHGIKVVKGYEFDSLKTLSVGNILRLML